MTVRRFVMLLFSLLATPGGAAEVPMVNQSARQIPVVYQVDVAVVGGGTGAVSAASAAAGEGATVFLAAPYPYLGDDMTATLRLWLEPGEEPASPLAKRIFTDQTRIGPKYPPPRPMHVKKTLDDVLLEAGVQFLYSCFATDVLRDGDGNPCGIVMANRAGRQAVIAKTIIDATDRGLVARLAGAKFRPYPAGMHTFRRVVIGAGITENLIQYVDQVCEAFDPVGENAPAPLALEIRPAGGLCEA